jgi:hypothetical protein
MPVLSILIRAVARSVMHHIADRIHHVKSKNAGSLFCTYVVCFFLTPPPQGSRVWYHTLEHKPSVLVQKFLGVPKFILATRPGRVTAKAR